MSKELVKKSLFKFLDDNLSIFITYNANENELNDITDLYSNSDITYVAPTPITDIILTQDSILFNTDIDLAGKILTIDDLNLSDTIASWDNITSTITLDNGFQVDISTENEIAILDKSLLYLKSPFGIPMTNTQFHNLGYSDRYDLYLKIKDDSNKILINQELQNIRDLIFSNKGNFKIYDNDLITILGYGRITDYSETEIFDVDNDIQSFLISFMVDYWMNY